MENNDIEVPEFEDDTFKPDKDSKKFVEEATLLSWLAMLWPVIVIFCQTIFRVVISFCMTKILSHWFGDKNEGFVDDKKEKESEKDERQEHPGGNSDCA